MAETIRIDLPDGAAEAHLSEPDGLSAGGVLFHMDAFGLRPRIAEMVDEIASWGHTVLAPNVFHRDGDITTLAPTEDLRVPEHRATYFTGARRRIDHLTPARFAADLPGYVAALRSRTDGPVAAIGYCMGARLAVRAAGQFPDDVVAVGGFHGGGLVTSATDSPHRVIPGTRAEYLFLHADGDRSMTPETVADLEQVLTDAGVAHVNEIVPGAPHGYTMSDTAAWRPEAYQRHLVALRDLLDRTLRAG